MVLGIMFGLMLGIGGIAPASLGQLADTHGLVRVCQECAYLPPPGLVAAFYPEKPFSNCGGIINCGSAATVKKTCHRIFLNSPLTVALSYRPPYQWQQMLSFLDLRAIPGVERVVDGEYHRTVSLPTREKRQVNGWVRVGIRPQRDVLAVTASPSLLPALNNLLARIRQLFDLRCEPYAVYEALVTMNTIRAGLCTLGTRLPGCFNAFEMAVRAVLGQQITVKAARTLAARLAEAYGVPIQTGVEGLTHLFPSPEAIIALDGRIENHLGPLGITGVRARTILKLAQAMVHREINLDFCAQPEMEIRKLMAIPGIGSWTAQYIAMRTLGWTDAFPHTDFGVRKALAPRTPKEILELAESWRPWRSYATVNLWNSL